MPRITLMLCSSLAITWAKFMDCGDAPLCGVLVLETGLGPGAYDHQYVGVHGLWPETGSYGSSECIKPSSSSADPSDVYACYDHPGGSGMSPLDFEKHEWDKHGRCAGVRDAADFFSQLCGLAASPVKVMASKRAAGESDLDKYRQKLEDAGFAVFDADSEHMQLELSACAGDDGRWTLAAVGDFGEKCRGSRPTPPTPTPTERCVHDEHGPPCESDDDCGFPGCVRCAHSGFCTDQPIQRATFTSSVFRRLFERVALKFNDA